MSEFVWITIGAIMGAVFVLIALRFKRVVNKQSPTQEPRVKWVGVKPNVYEIGTGAYLMARNAITEYNGPLCQVCGFPQNVDADTLLCANCATQNWAEANG